MTTEEGAGASAGAGELTGGGSGGAGGAGAGATAPEWMGALPDELKGDATLSRFGDVTALAKAHIESHKVARSKFVVPAADASDEEWGKAWSALGRPESPDGYGDFGLEALPDDADDAAKEARANMVKTYAERLHQLGVPARLASNIVKADIERIQEAEAAYYAKGAEEIAALKKELGADYEPQKNAAKSLFVRIFGEDAAPLADQLDQKVGSGLLMKGMIQLAKLTGERERIIGDSGEGYGGEPSNAQATLDAKMQDKTWRQRYLDGDTSVVAEYDRLLQAAQKQAARDGLA